MPRVWIALVMTLLSMPSSFVLAADWYFLNATAGTNYTIMRYADDGRADPPTAIIGPANNGGAQHTAWPSAFRIEATGQVLVYASRYVAGRWNDVALWISADGGRAFSLYGAVLVANAAEPYGIGPGQVYYDPSTPKPFKMIYLVRNASGTGKRMDLAVSDDGKTWERKGQILATSEAYEAAGFTPSGVTRANDGMWALFYHAYTTLAQGPAVVATAPGSEGPFGNKFVILEPNGKVHTVSGAARLTQTGSVSGTVAVGVPHVLRNLSGDGGMEVIVPMHQNGSTVWFDRPLLADYLSNAVLVHIAAFKIDPSMAKQNADGSWSGVFTGYGHFAGVTSEYTFRVEAPTLRAPWWAKQAPVPFSPWNPASFFSAENPTPLVVIGE